MNRQANKLILGNKIATFRNRPIGFQTWLLVIIPGSLLTLFSFIYGMLLAGNTFQQHGPALALMRARSWFVFGSVLLVVLTAYILFRILLSFQRLEIFKNGFRSRNSFLQKRSYLWRELSGITSSATRLTIFGKNLRTVPVGRIFPKSGKPIYLSNRIEGVPKLIRIVKSNIYPLLWPGLKSGFLQGEHIQFGRISLNKDFLQISKKKIPWSSVDKIWVDSGYLVVELREDSEGRIPLSNILNLELLLKVVDWGFQT
jgi:hypothetical protein